MRSIPRSFLRAAALLLVVSCSDSLAPNRVRPGGASRDVEITVGTLGVDMLFNGQTIGLSPQGDKCFTL